MPRPLTPQSKLPESTARLSQFLAENEISRTEIAKALGMSVSGLNSIFHRGVKLSVVQAKAIEQEYGISEKWILKGEEPKMVNPRDKLNFKMMCSYCHQIGTVGSCDQPGDRRGLRLCPTRHPRRSRPRCRCRSRGVQKLVHHSIP